MNLYLIQAFDKEEEDDPVCSYIITAESNDQAMSILNATRYAALHVRFAVAKGSLETTAEGPKFWGYVGGGTMLRAG